MLRAAGCADLIGETAEEYVDIAVALARSPERLARYRENLRFMVREFGLADAAAFVRKLEEAYLAMVSQARLRIVPGQAGVTSPVGTGSR